MRFALQVTVILLAGAPAVAQSSASFHLNEHTLIAGGQPANGTVSTSASFHLKLDAFGDTALGAMMTSASYHGDGGFVVAYRPPGEVTGLIFTSKSVMSWNPEQTVGFYETYRDTLSSLPSGSTGVCLASALTNTTVSDSGMPATGAGWFYLVTARNRLNEEGTKGTGQGGVPRPNPAPCP
jgi:hypothetical protein